MIPRVYSVHLRATVAAGATYQNVFWILNYNRTFKIKSTSFDYRIQDNVTGANIPIDTQNVLNIRMYIGDGAAGAPKISYCFENFTVIPVVPPVTDFNGTRFYLYKPKQLLFDSWYVENAIPHAVEIINHDLINAYYIDFSVITEIGILGYYEEPNK